MYILTVTSSFVSYSIIPFYVLSVTKENYTVISLPQIKRIHMFPERRRFPLSFHETENFMKSCSKADFPLSMKKGLSLLCLLLTWHRDLSVSHIAFLLCTVFYFICSSAVSFALKWRFTSLKMSFVLIKSRFKKKYVSFIFNIRFCFTEPIFFKIFCLK